MTLAHEIGGYMELERFAGAHYHKGLLKLHCCRSALMYALELRGVTRIWLPDLMCDVVPAACRQFGAEVMEYPVCEDLVPDYGAFEVGDGDYLLVVDYYGQLRDEDVGDALGASGGRLIVDETQGFFRNPWPGADTLYTCRKFFGVPDGGYLATHDGSTLGRELPRAESHGRMGHLLGRFERPAGEFYTKYSLNDGSLSGEPALSMSPLTDNLLRAIDYQDVKRRREENFSYLDSCLGESNLLSVHKTPGPFMYPYLMRNASGVRRRMAREGVFVPTLWPNVLEERSEGSVAYRYAEDLLPLPCDQRYGGEEMNRVLEVLVQCMN